MPLARFLETARARRSARLVESLDSSDGPVPWPTGTAHHFIVVAHGREPLYRHLSESLAGNPTIRVVLDRRRGERPAPATGSAGDRRRAERRWRIIDEQLRVFGWAVVRIDANSLPR